MSGTFYLKTSSFKQLTASANFAPASATHFPTKMPAVSLKFSHLST